MNLLIRQRTRGNQLMYTGCKSLLFLTLRDENDLCPEWNKGFLVWHFRQCKATFLHGKGSSCGYPVAGSIHILLNILIRYIRNIIKTIVVYIQNPGSNSVFFYALASLITCCRGGEWYLEKRGSRKILAGSRNLGSVFDKSRSLVFAWFVFTFFESRNFLPKSLGLGFLTGISASRRVSDFTIRHPLLWNHDNNRNITVWNLY